MPIGRDPLRGKLVITDLSPSLKWGRPIQFVKELIKGLAVVLPFSKNSDFAVYGSQAPTEDDKNKLWVADNNGGSFKGFFRFQKGAWRQVFNVVPREIRWVTGNSLNVPKGFRLIDAAAPVAGITVVDQQHIMTFYRLDPATVPPAPPVYTYYAIVWVGY